MIEHIFMPQKAICKLIHDMSLDIQRLINQRQWDHYYLIGIHTGGVWLARRLHALLNCSTPLGELDISFYRDDFTRIGMHPQVRPSSIPFQVEDQAIILIDDVLHTGRTIRAAMNEIFDFGRPASIALATLIERSGKELPIQADVVGLKLNLSEKEYLKLSPDFDLYISSPEDRYEC